VGVCWLFAVVALAGCSVVPRQAGPDSAARVATVYVIDRGWHTDIGVATRDVRGPLTAVERDFPGARYLAFGFGDRAYLLSPDRSLLQMLEALWPGPGAMLVTALRATPAEAFGASNVVALGVSAAGIERLVDFIWQDMDRTEAGAPLRIADGPYPGSAYYASVRRYDAIFTCNTWTAEALEVAGLQVGTYGVQLAGQVMDMVRALQRPTEVGEAFEPRAAGE